jgi:4'-phosphopantetheinyl transferase superfamily
MSILRKAPAAGELHVWRVEPEGDDLRDAARRALAAILAEYLGEAGAGDGGAAPGDGGAGIELRVDADGKPRLAVAPERLSFNLSHSGDLALVAIAPGGVEVGVDVERLRPRRDLGRLAERWLPAADAAAVAAAGEAEREAVFYAAWTRHEARVKCTGTGIAGPPPGLEVVAYDLSIDDGYAAAVAIETTDYGRGLPPVIWTKARQAGFGLNFGP